MSFLTVAGLTFRIENDSAQQRPITLHTLDMSKDLEPQDPRQDEVEQYDFTLDCESLEEAEEAERILGGEAHVFGFNGVLDAYGGLTPVAGYDPVQLLPVAGRFGGALEVFDSQAIEYGAQLGTDWTVIATVREDVADTPWSQVALTSDGSEWLNGSEIGPFGLTNIFTLNGTGLVLNGDNFAGTGADALFSELVIVPWLVRDETLAVWTDLDEPFSPFPGVYIRGDAFAYPLGIIATGVAVSSPYIERGGQSGGWENNATRLRFRVDENTPRDDAEALALPVAYYTFDSENTSGVNVDDIVAGLHDGTLLVGATAGQTPGREGFGEALDVSGLADSRMTAPDDAALDITGDLTLMCWINAAAISGLQWFIFKAVSAIASSPYKFGVASTGALQFEHRNAVETFNSQPGFITASTWIHVAIVRRVGQDVEFYCDGQRDVRLRQASAITPQANTAVLSIGADTVGADDFVGLMDEVAIYDEALSGDAILGAFLTSKRGGRLRAKG